MKRVILGLLALGVVSTPSFAQTTSAIVVPACTPAYVPVAQPGQPYPLTIDPNGNQCVVVANESIPRPIFAMPGPAVLGRWRQSCQCFTNPP